VMSFRRGVESFYFPQNIEDYITGVANPTASSPSGVTN
jgi:hypothetical protein